MNNSDAHAILKRDILLAIGALAGVRVTGRTSVGKCVSPEGAHVSFGLWVGCSDIVGIVKPRGRWLALEVKTGNARANPDQRRFLAMINDFGGVGVVVRSVDDALAALRRAQQDPARAA